MSHPCNEQETDDLNDGFPNQELDSGQNPDQDPERDQQQALLEQTLARASRNCDRPSPRGRSTLRALLFQRQNQAKP